MILFCAFSDYVFYQFLCGFSRIRTRTLTLYQLFMRYLCNSYVSAFNYTLYSSLPTLSNELFVNKSVANACPISHAGLNQPKLPLLAPQGVRHKCYAGLNQVKKRNLAPRGVYHKCYVGLNQVKKRDLAPRGVRHKCYVGLNQPKLPLLAPRGVRGKCYAGLNQPT